MRTSDIVMFRKLSCQIRETPAHCLKPVCLPVVHFVSAFLSCVIRADWQEVCCTSMKIRYQVSALYGPLGVPELTLLSA